MISGLERWVTRWAEKRPEAVALVLERERMTYGELERTSNRLARLLRKEGCATGDRVGLLLPKSPMAIAAILGVLKAGGIYVPLDAASPPARLAKIIDSCEPRWLLAAASVVGLLEELFREDRFRRSLRLGWLDAAPAAPARDFPIAFGGADLAEGSSTPPDLDDAVPDAAHILFTSGSTGTPKGVVVRRSSVIHFVEWANAYFGANRADRNSGHAPLHFDLSTYDIFGTLAAGAQLHLVPPALNVLPNKLADFIRRSELTQWFSVPAVLNYMAKLEAFRVNDFPTLKRVLWCGEVLPTSALIYWMKRLPHARFTNLYGPTEATIASGYYTVPACPSDETAAIPIGTACAGEELLVLDERLEPVVPGEVGDLYIRGAGLSPGYWGDPERTAAVFLPNPRSAVPGDRIYKTGDLARIGQDGLVYFLGRADSQIKSRGYRIELGEIEAALNAMKGLRECAVVAIPTTGFEGWTICCAFVPAPDAAVTPVTLRQELGKILPGFMLPTRWKALGRLPKNANGKTDRRGLKEQFEHVEVERETGQAREAAGTRQP
jgi:amino acid adenylation domain-containing protein